MSNAGYEDVRETIAQSLNRRFGTSFHAGNILMTVGAASGLNVILKTLLNPGEQVITFAPYFVEYGSYVRNYDGELVVVSPNTVDFQPNLVEFEERSTKNQGRHHQHPGQPEPVYLFRGNTAEDCSNFGKETEGIWHIDRASVR